MKGSICQNENTENNNNNNSNNNNSNNNNVNGNINDGKSDFISFLSSCNIEHSEDNLNEKNILSDE